MAGTPDDDLQHRERRITELVRIMRDAEAELLSLTGGQVDAVGGDHSGAHLLLSGAQAQLRASERAQREMVEMQVGILNALPAHIALLDASGVILAVNESWRRFASANALRRDDFAVGHNYISICEAAQGECAEEALQVARGIRDVIRGARSMFSIEYPCYSPTEQRWFRLMATPLTSAPGSGAVVMHVNVTDRRKAKERLQQSEAHFRLLIEGSARLLFYTHDRERRFEYLSPSTTGVLGHAPEALIGQPFDVLMIAGDPINHHALALHDGRSSAPYLLAVRHKDGRRIVLEIVESPILRDGTVVGIQGVAHDITERVQAQSGLANSEAWFRGFFDQASVGMVIKSEDGRYLRVNRSFAEIIGRPEADTIGLPYADATHPDDREREAQILTQMRAGQLAATRWEKRYLRPDGSVVWCRLSLSLVRVAEGGERQFIGVVEDISERQRAEEALLRSRDLLRIAGATAKLGGWVLELEPMRLLWSDEVLAMHEVPAGFEPTLEQAVDFYDPESRDAVAQAVSHCVKDGIPFSFEQQIVTWTGRRIWVLAIGEAIRDAQGRIVRVQGAFQDISARKAAEASVAESQRRFRLMADGFPFIVWTAEPDGRVDYANRRMIEYTQVNAAEPPDTRWQPFVHPDELPGCLEAWAAAVAGGKSYAMDYRLRQGASGNYRWFRVQAEPVRDAGGNIVKWYGTGLDIDETRRLEQEAWGLAERLRDTLESITDGFFVLDRDWNFSFLNTQAHRLLDRPEGSLLGKHVWTEFPQAVGSPFQRHYEQATRSGRSVHFQDYYPPPLERWYDVSAYPGEEGLAVYFRDVTQARQSMAQLRLLEAAVARLNDIVLITEAEPIDGEGPRIVFVNDAFVRRTGYTRDEAIGKTPRILQGAKTQRAELDRIRTALQAWQPVRAELINYTKAGEEFWLELDIVPLSDASGWFTHWVAVERDVTERRQTAEQLRQSQRLESVGQLTGGVAHDFNNLLTVILGNAELLHERLQGERLAPLAGMIVEAAERGADLTHRLLAFARRQTLDPRVVDVNRLAANLEPLLQRSLGEQFQIVFHLGADLWPALVDPSQLENALLNLCINARDAMPAGGRLTVETANVQLEQEYAERHAELKPGTYVLLAVSDEGGGIPPEILERVFEPFFTTKEQGKGTGLGLAMVYGFVKQSGGHVNLYSEVGKGTTVKLYLPQAVVSATANEQQSVPKSQAGGSERILMVEDDELLRKLAAQLLRSFGYQVQVVADAAQALQILRSTEPVDMLFTDVVMPGVGGRELVAEALKIRPGLPVLFTSGYTETAISKHDRLDPGITLLSKPYRKDEMARKVREVLDRRPVYSDNPPPI